MRITQIGDLRQGEDPWIVEEALGRLGRAMETPSCIAALDRVAEIDAGGADRREAERGQADQGKVTQDLQLNLLTKRKVGIVVRRLQSFCELVVDTGHGNPIMAVVAAPRNHPP